MDLDQLASLMKPADLDLHCFHELLTLLSYPQSYQYSVIISLLISTHHVDVKQCASGSAGFIDEAG